MKAQRFETPSSNSGGSLHQGVVVYFTIAIVAWGTTAASGAWIGSRSTPVSTSMPVEDRQLVSDGDWSVLNGGFRIDFEVEKIGSEFKYTYTFLDTDGTDLEPSNSWDLSIEVSYEIPGADYEQESGTSPPQPECPNCNPSERISLTPMLTEFHLWDAPASDPTFPLYALFIGDDDDSLADELSDGTVTIWSSQGPMWGSFYARNGSPGAYAEAVNRGFNEGVFPNPLTGLDLPSVGPRPAFDPLADPNGLDLGYWILVPDTYLPEPSSWVLVLMAAAIAGCRRWRPNRLPI